MLILFQFILVSIFIGINSFQVSIVTKKGTIIGNREATIFDGKIYYAFYAVPYAKAPIGKLRFKDPKPAQKFKFPFDATTEYHGTCAQSHIVHKHAMYGVEDCLHLNIYTPYLPDVGKHSAKAVIVWIHGYAFTSSFSHIYGPDFLIENDIIFISLTHRIGVFGFLKLNATDSNANMGLKDIVTGLKWINNNVGFFGGDKRKITVMGSGSACTFLTLLLMSKHRKLFSKLILQSGSIFSPSIFQGNENEEKTKLEKELKRLGATNIKEASTKNLLDASRKIYNAKDLHNIQRPVIPFSPIKEIKSNQALLTKNLEDIYKTISRVNFHKPILVGFTTQEGISELIPFIHNSQYINLYGKDFNYMVPFGEGCKFKYSTKKYASIANKIKEYYFKSNISEHSIDGLLTLASDLQKYPVYKYIKSQLNVKNDKLYVYKFDYVSQFNIVKSTSVANAKLKIKGAAQGDELCYIFKCEPMWEAYVKIKNDYHNPERIFIKTISEMWANFAKFADPTPFYNDSKKWLPMTLEHDNIMILGKRNKLTTSEPEKHMFNFWNEIYTNDYEKQNCNPKRDEL